MDSLSSEAREVDALIQANLPAVKSALASRAAPGIIAKAPPTVVAPGVDRNRFEFRSSLGLTF